MQDNGCARPSTGCRYAHTIMQSRPQSHELLFAVQADDYGRPSAYGPYDHVGTGYYAQGPYYSAEGYGGYGPNTGKSSFGPRGSNYTGQGTYNSSLYMRTASGRSSGGQPRSYGGGATLPVLAAATLSPCWPDIRRRLSAVRPATQL